MKESKYLASKTRPPIKCHGGKSYLCRRMIALFPWHSVYVEPFLGGGSVFLNKKPASLEVISDLNYPLINMWRQLQSNSHEFRKALRRVTYDEQTFRESKTNVLYADPLISAVAYMCICRMSRGGTGRSFAWSKRLRGIRSDTGPIPGELNSWNTFLDVDMPRIVERIEDNHVDILCSDWHLVLEEYGNRPHTLIYLDPPYIKSTRSVRTAYGEHEMQSHEHLELIRYLRNCKATWFLSAYESTLYTKILGDFPRHEWSMPNHSGQGKVKQRRVELLYTNHAAVDFKQLEMEVD